MAQGPEKTFSIPSVCAAQVASTSAMGAGDALEVSSRSCERYSAWSLEAVICNRQISTGGGLHRNMRYATFVAGAAPWLSWLILNSLKTPSYTPRNKPFRRNKPPEATGKENTICYCAWQAMQTQIWFYIICWRGRKKCFFADLVAAGRWPEPGTLNCLRLAGQYPAFRQDYVISERNIPCSTRQAHLALCSRSTPAPPSS